MKLRAIAAAAACVSTMVLAQFAPTYADGMPNDDDENFNPVPSVPGVPAPGVKQPAPIKQNSTPTGISTPASTPVPAPVAAPPAPKPVEPTVAPVVNPAPKTTPEPVAAPAPSPTPPTTTPAQPAAPVVTPKPAPAPVAPVTPPTTPAAKPDKPAVSQPAPATIPAPVGMQKTIYEVLSVDVAIQEKNPVAAVITVRGSARTGGWKVIELKPLQTVAPEVGMRSYTLVGTPPTGFATQSLTPVSATITIDPLPANVKTIRVLSESNEVAQTFR